MKDRLRFAYMPACCSSTEATAPCLTTASVSRCRELRRRGLSSVTCHCPPLPSLLSTMPSPTVTGGLVLPMGLPLVIGNDVGRREAFRGQRLVPGGRGEDSVAEERPPYSDGRKQIRILCAAHRIKPRFDARSFQMPVFNPDYKERDTSCQNTIHRILRREFMKSSNTPGAGLKPETVNLNRQPYPPLRGIFLGFCHCAARRRADDNGNRSC
jgi:hypothetical protein